MPLSHEKCAVIHCGNQETVRNYAAINNTFLVRVHVFEDLGIMLPASHACYEGNCQAIYSKANQEAEAIKRFFRLNAPELLWWAFENYIIPILMCNSTA